MTGKTATIERCPEDTIYEFKQRIQDREGCPPEITRLSFNARMLADDKTLTDYNIGPGAELFAMLALRGGMFHVSSGRLNGQDPVSLTVWFGSSSMVLGVNLDRDTTLSVLNMARQHLRLPDGKEWKLAVHHIDAVPIDCTDDTTIRQFYAKSPFYPAVRDVHLIAE